jgi:arylsulfatase A-like enzyme
LGLLDNTLVIVTADHGGTPGLKKGHSANDDDNRLVPWVAVGPGIKRDYEIAGRSDLPPIKHPRNGKTSVAATMLLYDTAPTIQRILNMAPDSIPNLSPHAKPVDEIFVTD